MLLNVQASQVTHWLKNPPAHAGFDPWIKEIPWRRKWQPTPVFLPGNPTDRRTWRARVHVITMSQTRQRRRMPALYVWAGLILLCLTSLYFADAAFFTHRRFWQHRFEEVHFFNSICSLCFSMSHFGNSHNISKFFIIIIFVMATCDPWSLMSLL